MGVTRHATTHLYDKCIECPNRRHYYECMHESMEPGNTICCWMRKKRGDDMIVPKKCPLKGETMKKKFDFTKEDVEAFKAFYTTQNNNTNDPAVEKVKEAFDLGDRDTSAEVMSELLMDDEWSTYKMFEGLASDYLDGNDDVRKGIDCATTALTAWSMKTIAEKVIKAHKEKENSTERDETAKRNCPSCAHRTLISDSNGGLTCQFGCELGFEPNVPANDRSCAWEPAVKDLDPKAAVKIGEGIFLVADDRKDDNDGSV